MELNLHANATTTPKIRAYIQASEAPVCALCEELGVSETTVRRWRGRTEVHDRSSVPKRSLSDILCKRFFRHRFQIWFGILSSNMIAN